MAATIKPNELHITRVYDAPVKMVWDAWNDPAQVVKWWGPRGFTHTTHSKDLRVGGNWRYTMHGPDGTDWPNVTKYHEVELYSKMVYDHGGTDDTPPLFRVTVTFLENAGKTTIDMTMAFESVEKAKEISKFIKQAGGNSTWDRLGEYLDKKIRNEESFVINRSFAAPLEVMFKMWTNPEHFAKWLPPTGFEMKFLKADIRPGGATMYMMGNGDFTMYGRAQYLEIAAPNRLVYTQQFCDEQGNISRHPGAPTWPETMLTTVTLTAEGPAQTRVTVKWETHGSVTAEELQAFINEKPGMTIGWTGSFDKLEEYLQHLG